MKSLAKILILLIFPLSIFGQSYQDALRLSRTENGGTARFLSLGGAFTALGGDLGAINVNPAGIAVIRQNTITISACLFTNTSESKFLLDGNKSTDFDYNFNLSNIGIVGTFSSGKTEGFKNFSIGYTYNATNRFNQNIVTRGINNKNSRLDYWVNDANGGVWNDFEHELAYRTNLLSWDSEAGEYWSDITDAGVYGLFQSKEVTNTGYSGEHQFSFGANFQDVLFLGTSIGIPVANFRSHSTFSESDNTSATVLFNEYYFDEDIDFQGAGFNFKFGVIGKPAEWLRIGASIHSPTFWSFDTDYQTTIDYDDQYYPDDVYEEGDEKYSSYYTNSNFTFKLNSPFKANTGLAVIFEKFGLLSFDYEYVDYTKSRLRADDYSYTTDNDNITDYLAATHNLRAGAEFRVNIFSIRGGYGYSTSPYSNKYELEDAVKNSISAGFGINSGNFFLDFAYTHSKYKHTDVFYDPYIGENLWVGGDVTSKSNRFILTTGFRF